MLAVYLCLRSYNRTYAYTEWKMISHYKQNFPYICPLSSHSTHVENVPNAPNWTSQHPYTPCTYDRSLFSWPVQFWQLVPRGKRFQLKNRREIMYPLNLFYRKLSLSPCLISYCTIVIYCSLPSIDRSVFSWYRKTKQWLLSTCNTITVDNFRPRYEYSTDYDGMMILD